MDQDQPNDHILRTLGDVRYFKAIMANEIADVRRSVNDAMGSVEDPNLRLRVVVDELLSAIGKLGARVRIMEQIMTSEAGATLAEQVHVDTTPPDLPELHATYSLAAEDMDHVANVYELEFGVAGAPCRWTGPERITTFRLPIYRKDPRRLAIAVVGVVKPEFLRKLTISVDGEPRKYEVTYEGGANNLVLEIPATTRDQITELSIEVPETVSPLELGASPDPRRLGIAISAIQVKDSPAPDSAVADASSKIA